MLPLRSQFNFYVLCFLLSHRTYDAVVRFHSASIPKQLHGSSVGLVSLPDSVFEDRGEEKQREKEKSDYITTSSTHPSC